MNAKIHFTKIAENFLKLAKSSHFSKHFFHSNGTREEILHEDYVICRLDPQTLACERPK